MTLFEELQWRGLVKDISDPKIMKEKLHFIGEQILVLIVFILDTYQVF